MRRSLILLAFSVLAACGRHNHVANVASTDIWPMFQRAPDHNAVLANQDLIARWSLPAGAQVNGGFALAGTTLFADTFGKELLAIDARSGKVLWRAGADDVLMSTPVLGDGIVYVGSGTNARLPTRRSRAIRCTAGIWFGDARKATRFTRSTRAPARSAGLSKLWGKICPRPRLPARRWSSPTAIFTRTASMRQPGNNFGSAR